jgi:hypothetical protein
MSLSYIFQLRNCSYRVYAIFATENTEITEGKEKLKMLVPDIICSLTAFQSLSLSA